jgi:hypothetical protein
MNKTKNNEFNSKDELDEIDSVLTDFFKETPPQETEAALESRQDAVLKKVNHQIGAVSLVSMFSAWVWVILAAIGASSYEFKSQNKNTKNKVNSEQTPDNESKNT